MPLNEHTPNNDRGDTPASPDGAATLAHEAAHFPSIPGFQVKRLLGEGGMAKVFLAEDLNLRRSVAVKVMSAALNNDEQFRQRFDEEGRIVAKFRHPNLVVVFASGEIDQQRYIVMEYVAGGTLSERIANGPLNLNEALAIGRSMADALRYSHENGIVHRDVKPGNILFTATNEPILSDFGIAKSAALDSVQTVAGGVIGSPLYMAPEQLLGKAVSDKTDVYSLGLVLYEMLTGKVPTRQLSVVRSVSEVKALQDTLPSTAKFCATFIGECLRLEPSERPSAHQCVVMLTDLIGDRSILRSRPSQAVLYVAVAALVLAGGAYVLTKFVPGELSNRTRPSIATDSPSNNVLSLANFDVQPSSARIFIDGERLTSAGSRLTEGSHQAAVINRVSYGQLLSVDTSLANRYAVSLQPIDLPTQTEFVEFNRRFNADSPVSEAVPGNIRYAPYLALLELRADHLQGRQTAVAERLMSLRALARYGDPVSRLMLFIAATDHLVDDPTDSTLEWVEEASKDGYALATFYYALHYRWSHEVDGALDATALRGFRDLMAQAQRQGLGFAADAVRDAEELLRNTSREAR